MPALPAHPDLDQLRRQARELQRAAAAGDAAALTRLRRVSDRTTLAAAQLALARSYGFASWPALKTEVEARSLELAVKAEAFLRASIRDGSGRAARMLAATPELASYSFATALVLGDDERVGAALARHPGHATRRDPRSGFSALEVVCASRWYQFDPGKASGLLACAQALIAAGAAARPRARGGWSPLRCAVASANSGASNRPLIELLLAHGAIPGDEELYLAGFAPDRHQLLPLLLGAMPNVRRVAAHAFAAPIGKDDSASLRALLEAGADPRRATDDDGAPTPAVWAAVDHGASAELLELLLSHGADAQAAGPDGRSPYRRATAAGRGELVALLERFGARDDASRADHLLAACLRGDRSAAAGLLAHEPELIARLDDNERAAFVRAAAAGNSAAVRLMLELGFPIEARGENGATALHAAAYAGAAPTVALLLAAGAEIEARDTAWNSTPLEWASVGSGERPGDDPAADWLAAARTLLEHGASTAGVSLGPDLPKQPSPEVAALIAAARR